MRLDPSDPILELKLSDHETYGLLWKLAWTFVQINTEIAKPTSTGAERPEQHNELSHSTIPGGVWSVETLKAFRAEIEAAIERFQADAPKPEKPPHGNFVRRMKQIAG